MLDCIRQSKALVGLSMAMAIVFCCCEGVVAKSCKKKLVSIKSIELKGDFDSKWITEASGKLGVNRYFKYDAAEVVIKLNGRPYWPDYKGNCYQEGEEVGQTYCTVPDNNFTRLPKDAQWYHTFHGHPFEHLRISGKEHDFEGWGDHFWVELPANDWYNLACEDYDVRGYFNFATKKRKVCIGTKGSLDVSIGGLPLPEGIADIEYKKTNEHGHSRSTSAGKLVKASQEWNETGHNPHMFEKESDCKYEMTAAGNSIHFVLSVLSVPP